MNPTPNPHVHGGDHYRDNTVCAIDLTGCGGTPNDGIRVRAELTYDEALELHERLGRLLDDRQRAQLDRALGR